jgi:hypothetical protein
LLDDDPLVCGWPQTRQFLRGVAAQAAGGVVCLSRGSARNQNPPSRLAVFYFLHAALKALIASTRAGAQ